MDMTPKTDQAKPSSRRNFLRMGAGATLAGLLASCGREETDAQTQLWQQRTAEGGETAIHREGRKLLEQLHLVEYEVQPQYDMAPQMKQFGDLAEENGRNTHSYLFPVQLSANLKVINSAAAVARCFGKEAPRDPNSPLGYFAAGTQMHAITGKNWKQAVELLKWVRQHGTRITDHPPLGTEKMAVCEYQFSPSNKVPPPADGTNDMGERDYPRGFGPGQVTIALPMALAKLQGAQLQDPEQVAAACGRDGDGQVLGEYKIFSQDDPYREPTVFPITRENLEWSADFLQAVREKGRNQRVEFLNTGAGRSL